MPIESKPNYAITPIKEDIAANEAVFQQQLVSWAQAYKCTVALAHADDGVNWGWFDEAQSVWHWSHQHYRCSPMLRIPLLQHLRLFGATCELFIWRDGAGLKGRLIQDDAAAKADDDAYTFDEAYLLWGTETGGEIPETDGFTLREDRAQGLRHAPPTAIATRGKLTVRHYLDYDEKDGSVCVVASRLVAPATYTGGK